MWSPGWLKGNAVVPRLEPPVGPTAASSAQRGHRPGGTPCGSSPPHSRHRAVSDVLIARGFNECRGGIPQRLLEIIVTRREFASGAATPRPLRSDPEESGRSPPAATA